ncbi:17051_t:CDS:2, partial [Racocetra persica]
RWIYSWCPLIYWTLDLFLVPTNTLDVGFLLPTNILDVGFILGSIVRTNIAVLKHQAQFNLSRNITSQETPILQSVNETLITVLPPKPLMSDHELSLHKQLDPSYFNIQTPINLQALQFLTKSHPNHLFI